MSTLRMELSESSIVIFANWSPMVLGGALEWLMPWFWAGLAWCV